MAESDAKWEWPDEKLLQKPDGATAPVWSHFWAEKLAAPIVQKDGTKRLYGEWVYCRECKKLGTKYRQTYQKARFSCFLRMRVVRVHFSLLLAEKSNVKHDYTYED